MTDDQPSDTALLIAAATVLATFDRSLASLVQPGSADRSRELLQVHPAGRRLLRSIESPLGRWRRRVIERVTLPGIALHYQLRKLAIARATSEAASVGFRRLIVLGAGLDTLGIRAASAGAFSDVLEVDHPATQSIKRAWLDRNPVPSLRLLPCDIGRDGKPIELRASATDSVVVAEGLLMYLEPARVDALVDEVARSGRRVRFIFTFMERPPTGPAGFRPRSRAVEWWLKSRREPFRWDLPLGRLSDWLQSRGFTLTGYRTMPQLRHDAAAGQTYSLRGEVVAVADRGST